MEIRQPKGLLSRGARRHQGFTIIELLIVVIVIGILAAAGISKYQSFSEKARQRTCCSNQNELDSAMATYFSQYHELSTANYGSMYFSPYSGVGRVQQDSATGGNAYGFGAAGSTTGIFASLMGDVKGFMCPGDLSLYYGGDRNKCPTNSTLYTISNAPAAYGGDTIAVYGHSFCGRELPPGALTTAGSYSNHIQNAYGNTQPVPLGHSFVFCYTWGLPAQNGPDGSANTRHSIRW